MSGRSAPRFRNLRLCLLSVLLILADQATKSLAADRLREGPFVLIPGVFELRFVENRGAAFGILSNGRVFFIVLGLVFLAVCLLFLARVRDSGRFLPLAVCAAVLIAGDAGNLTDRIVLGYVRDFLYFRLIDFPVFNIADICVTCAGGAALVLILFRYRDEELAALRRK